MTPHSSERCDFRLDIGVTEGGVPDESCDRPTWEDYDRCIWHAEEDGKTESMLSDHEPDSGEALDGAHLREASLVGVDWFAETSLVGADFTDADVSNADFTDADMQLATLTNISAINTDFSGANLEGAIFTNADLRRATLAGALLNEAVLTDVHIGNGTDFGDRSVYDHEDVQPVFTDTHRLEAAAWSYRELQQLYQDNGLPQLAQQSYNREKDARRRLAWDRGQYARAIKWELSRWVMRYGSSPYRVLGTSLLVVVVSALLFPFTGGIQEVHSNYAITYTVNNPETTSPIWLGKILFKSLYFSLVTFATLGYGDIQPVGAMARLLATIVTILGSLLSALLVFVLARIVTW